MVHDMFWVVSRGHGKSRTLTKSVQVVDQDMAKSSGLLVSKLLHGPWYNSRSIHLLKFQKKKLNFFVFSPIVYTESISF